MVVTPLAPHGGVAPPLVVGPDSRVGLAVEPGYGGSRFELDGQEVVMAAPDITVSLRRDHATLVTLADEEPPLTALRRRGLVVDGPRILARDARAASSGPSGQSTA
jgi:NAD kinase